ncbi:sensor histidine kinase [Yinghuangia soli]|uniref:histidine kinase n=1 Tax=Yinghuangia soli TaxID=2908204 RepID=A0AA41Q3A5_9ACTN|nr:histidine kinase [Yinghuangia soli]MCF2530195.1 histidine kinase [Yinghuangia soli]
MGFGPMSMATFGKAITGRDLAEPAPSAPAVRTGIRRLLGPWTPADVLIPLVVGAVDLFGYFITATPAQTDRPVLGGTFLLLSAACLLFRRRAPLPVLAAVLVLGTTINLLTEMPPRYGFAVVVALYTVGLACRPAVTAGAAVLTVAAQTSGYGNEDQSLTWMASSDVVATILVLAVSAGVRHWQQQLEVNRALLADRALTDERRRIARELHDIVAHHVTTMHLMSGAARANLDRDPDAARGALLTLEASGRVALGEMRQLLGVLRSDDDTEHAPSAPQPGVDDLDRLVAESCLAGLPTELEIAGPRRELPLPVGLALYRISQEALTNARKHAGRNAQAQVRLEYLPNRVVLRIGDDGGTAPDPGRAAQRMPGGGHGLVGMRERVAVHRGTFEAGPLPDGGFAVAAAIPVPAHPYETAARRPESEEYSG